MFGKLGGFKRSTICFLLQKNCLLECVSEQVSYPMKDHDTLEKENALRIKKKPWVFWGRTDFGVLQPELKNDSTFLSFRVMKRLNLTSTHCFFT